MVLIQLNNRGKLGVNPYTAAKRFAAAMLYLHDYERSCFRERYRCALNRDVGGGGYRESWEDVAIQDASDRYLAASRLLDEKKVSDVCRHVIIEDKKPKQILGNNAGAARYKKFYEELCAGLDVLIVYYGV